MSVRILGGAARGRSFAVPASARPSGVRVRKSLFDLLAVRVPEGTFLDLHGGSGAVALEAASRGYAVTACERDPAAVRTLQANARSLGLPLTVLAGDVLALLPRLLGAGQRFSVVFSDPPFSHDIPQLTAWLLALSPLRPDGLLVAQHPSQVRLPEADGYTLERRNYGSNVLSLYAPDETGREGDGSGDAGDAGA